jgi:uncharacterized protein (DUF1501 family)
MSNSDCQKGCQEYRELSRRRFLGLSAGVVAAAATPTWLPRVVLADTENSSRDVIVSIFLRGGWDGLSVCVPHADDRYYQLRPSLAIPRPGSGGANAATDLDGFFGLPPALQPLLEVYQDGNLLLVHACGSKDPTRSHFDAMNFMEVGMPNPPVSMYTGWLGRHLQTTAPTLEEGVLRAVGIGHGLQRTLVGGPATLPIADLAEFGFAGDPASSRLRRRALEDLYAGKQEPLRSAAQSTFRTVDLLEQIDFQGYTPAGGTVYPEGELGYALKSTAALIKAEVGVEAVAIDYGGWDTHENQMPLEGTMASLMQGFGQGLAAFHKDLFTDDFTNLVVVAMSEFGRNVAENGSQGTDHGHGSVMVVLGGGIAGGRVLSQWPGLGESQLFEDQDLEITIDYRDILTEIATRRLGNPDYRNVFPDEAYTPVDHQITL